MPRSHVRSLLRDLLTRWLKTLDQKEAASPRSQKKAWYHFSFHLPPIVIAIASGIVFFFSLIAFTHHNLIQLSILAICTVFSIGLFSFYVARDYPTLAREGNSMGLLAVIFFTTFFLIKLISLFEQSHFWLSPYITPLGTAPLLVMLLLHPGLGVVLSFLIAMLFGIMNNYSFDAALVGTLGCFAILAAARKARNTNHVLRACLFAGLIQSITVLFIAILQDRVGSEVWIDIGSAFLSGLLVVFIALGSLPILEVLFSRISNLRLVELSDVNHPLLQKLSLEAPGTYHHSLVVASLAEDAANAIGANGLLCRVGAYFHDVGKTVKSEYFVENQAKMGNPHDQVSPSLSRLIITSHVKEGVALARAYKLDQQIVDFIPQHHGTSKIEYFYHKALQLEEQEDELAKEEVSVESYRYPGPKPQSKETGIVMLADSSEAAARTIEEPNHQRIQDLVYKIINKKLADGQLDETPLTLRDLRTIGTRFTLTLSSIYHERVPYPDMNPPPQTLTLDEAEDS